MSISTNLDIVSVTYNGTSIPVAGGGTSLQGKTVSYTPATSSQTDTITADSGYDGLSSVEVTVAAMPTGSASTPATTITATPSLSVNSSTGVVTGSVSASKSVTPVVSAGYVSSGTAGTVTVSGSDTLQLSTQAATTITPTESAQTAVSAGKYTTGAVTVAAIDSGYVGSGVTQNDSSDLTASGATVTAPAGYYESSASKSVASGSASTPATTITANPSLSINTSTGVVTGSVSASKSVTPTVSAGYVSSGTAGTITVSGSDTLSLSTQAAKTVTPTTSAQTAVAAGKYTTGAVTVAAMPSGTAGTPSATKGTVSGNAISVTPSVTNTTGYITGGTKTGTAVSVSASELVSGSVSITSNGTVDVTNYASVVVNVSGGGGSGTTIDTAGTYSLSSGDTITMGSGLAGTLKAKSSTPTLTNNWDLTSSLTDTVGSKTITLYSSATQDSSGLTIAGGSQYARIPIAFDVDKTYEFDIASMTKSYSSGHGRFIMVSTGEGFIWRSNGYWDVYIQGAWGQSAGTDYTAFSGKTLKITTDEYYTAYYRGISKTFIMPKIYCDGTLFYQPNLPFGTYSSIMLGSSSASAYTFVCTAIRVYDGCAS